MKKLFEWIKSPKSDFVLFVMILVLANVASRKAFFRLDLTSQGSYSISKVSKDTVKTLTEPLSVKVFFSDNLPAPYNATAQYVKDILVEYKGAANSNFSYQFFNMKKAENQRIASGYGLRQVQIQQIKNSEVGVKQVWMGLAITYGDAIETIDGISSDSGFEYNLTTKISKMISQADTLAGLAADDKINVTLYSSAELEQFRIANFDNLQKLAQEAFNSVNQKNKNRLQFSAETPAADEMDSTADKYGLQLINWQNKDGSEGKGIFGLVVEHNGAFRTVPLSIQRSFFGYGISGLDNIEENLSASLESLLSKSTEIGYIKGHSEAELSDQNGNDTNFKKLLSDSYSFKEINLSESDIPLNISTIIINAPKEKFAEAELYKIDQFLLKGGNVMLFQDPFNSAQENYYQAPTYEKIDTGLNTILEKYGVKLESNYVFDEGCYTYNQQGYGKIRMYWAPMLAKQQLSQKNVISKNLGYVILLQPGEISTAEAEKNKDLKVSVLAKSSPKSWTMTQNFDIGPNMQTPYDKSVYQSHNLAVLVEGKFPSAFESNPAEEQNSSAAKDGLKTTSHLAKGTQTGRIFAVNTAYAASNQLINDDGSEPIAMFVRNAADYMNGNADLCTMRTKGLTLNTMQNTNSALALVIRYFNQFGLTVLVAAAGFAMWRIRSIRRRKIHDKYNPNDKREIK